MFKKLALCLTLALATLATDVQIKNLRLFVGENEYFIKGMAYSPSPLEKVYDGQNEGTGLCKPRPTYATGSHSAVIQTSGCNSEDYFDAAVYSFGNPNGWFTALWERDFPLIQQLGVNTIRIYHAFPVTQAAITNGAYTDKTVVGSNHIPFMDSAQAHNLKVVFPLFAESASLDTLDPSWIQEYARNIIDEVGNHPALLMYTFGNELQFSSRDQAYIDKINGFIDYARNYQATKWGRKIPITVAVIDIPSWYNILFGSNGLHVDLITTNAGYRGFTFTDLYSSNLYPLACSRGLPSLIGEMGVHLDTPQFDVPGWFPAMWSDVIGHKTQGSIGGFYFSWVEEHWKGVVPGADWTKYPDVRMGVVSQQSAGGSDPFAADVVVKKYGTAYDWDAAVSGYAQDPFKQDSAQTLSSAKANYCDGTFQVVPAIPPPTQAWKPDPTTVTTMPTPMAYFSFDTSANSKVTDLSGNGHDAVLYGNPSLAQGVSGKALNLDGTQTAMLSGLGSLSGTFTVSVWIYLNSAPDAETKILSSKSSWDDANGFEVTLNPDQKIIKMVGGGSSVAQYGGLAISTGNWFHVAVTVESSGRVNLYFNGIQAAAATGVSPVVSSSNGLFLGSENDKVAFLAAGFDELLVFGSVVGGDQIQRLANSNSLPQFQVVVPTTSAIVDPVPSTSSNGPSASTGGNTNVGSSTSNAGGNSPSSTVSPTDTMPATTTASNNGNSNGSTTGAADPTPPSTVQRPQNSAGSTVVTFSLIVIAMLALF